MRRSRTRSRSSPPCCAGASRSCSSNSSSRRRARSATSPSATASATRACSPCARSSRPARSPRASCSSSSAPWPARSTIRNRSCRRRSTRRCASAWSDPRSCCSDGRARRARMAPIQRPARMARAEPAPPARATLLRARTAARVREAQAPGRSSVVNLPRVVITGVGLTSPNGDNLPEFRRNLIEGVSGVEEYSIRHVGSTLAGVCHFDTGRYQKKKEARRGTRAGAIAIWCANQALEDAGLKPAAPGPSPAQRYSSSRIGIFTGITEHGNVETENQIHEVAQYGFDLSFWSHHHNPRTVANNPAGEVTLNLGVSGPAYSLGGACAAGNLGLIHGAQMLQLGQVDLALGGGVSESIHTFGIFASFRAQGALARHEQPAKASRPFDAARNGIVVAEGGCLFALERLDDALARGARIYAEVAGYHVNSDASDFVLPCSKGQETCIRGALAHAGVAADEIDLVNTH